jgi:hypothetical protein
VEAEISELFLDLLEFGGEALKFKSGVGKSRHYYSWNTGVICHFEEFSPVHRAPYLFPHGSLSDKRAFLNVLLSIQIEPSEQRH